MKPVAPNLSRPVCRRSDLLPVGSISILMMIMLSLTIGGCVRDQSHHHHHATNAPEPALSAIDAGESQAISHDHKHDHGHSHPHAHGDHGHAHSHSDDAAIDHAAFHPASDPAAPCTCRAAIDHHGWCRKCNVGYIAGVKVESAKLFSTVDAHGHYVDLNVFTAKHCRDAIANDGFCTQCRMGFVKGLAYFTRLTHGLVQGVAVRPESLSCSACATMVGATGWCGECGRGFVGNVMLRDRSLHETTAREFSLFQNAMVKARTCDGCAAGMVLHSGCPFCLIDYP